MFGKNPRVTPREARKRLLLAESELNRAQLVQEWQAMTGEIHSLANRARTIGSFASATALLMAGLAAFRRKKPAPVGEKPSWWLTALKGAGLVSTCWRTFRRPDREHPGI